MHVGTTKNDVFEFTANNFAVEHLNTYEAKKKGKRIYFCATFWTNFEEMSESHFISSIIFDQILGCVVLCFECGWHASITCWWGVFSLFNMQPSNEGKFWSLYTQDLKSFYSYCLLQILFVFSLFSCQSFSARGVHCKSPSLSGDHNYKKCHTMKIQLYRVSEEIIVRCSKKVHCISYIKCEQYNTSIIVSHLLYHTCKHCKIHQVGCQVFKKEDEAPHRRKCSSHER